MHLFPEITEQVWKYFPTESLPNKLKPDINIKISIAKCENVELFKEYAVKYVFEHFKRFNRRKWLQELQPVLKETIEQISRAKDDTITFFMMENLLLFLLKEIIGDDDIDPLIVMKWIRGDFENIADKDEWIRRSFRLDSMINYFKYTRFLKCIIKRPSTKRLLPTS